MATKSSDESFAARAPVYDTLTWIREDALLKHIIGVADVGNNDRVVDVATGTGALLEAFQPLARTAVGLDRSVHMLAKTKIRRAVVGGDAEKLPFTNRSFDVCLCRNGLHHFNRPRQFLEEVRRVLRSDGRLIVSEPVAPTRACLAFWTHLLLTKDLGRNAEMCFTEQQLCDFLQDCGYYVARSSIVPQRVNVENWLGASGLSEQRKEVVRQQLRNAPRVARNQMRIAGSGETLSVEKLNCVLRLI